MTQKQAMIKLAQVRLAINYVLRQRMTKKATSGAENPTIPSWNYNPYGDNRKFFGSVTSPDGKASEYYFRNQQELDHFMTHPDTPLRQGTDQDLYKRTPLEKIREKIGPVWNHGLDLWQHQRNKSFEDWRKRYSEYWNSPSAPGVFDSDYWEKHRKWDKENPAPPQAPPMPDDLYMKTPTGRYY